MKDFYDVWQLSLQYEFDGKTLQTAIKKTFENRSTSISPFEELSMELRVSGDKQVQWEAFLKKSALNAPDKFNDVLDALTLFLKPLLDATLKNTDFDATSDAGGSWRKKS